MQQAFEGGHVVDVEAGNAVGGRIEQSPEPRRRDKPLCRRLAEGHALPAHGGGQVLPPYAKSKNSEWYKGTANAIYQNIGFIQRYNPDNVLILSGDHVYKMDYDKMLRAHEQAGAACTISVIQVSMDEASRFGIMNVGADGFIEEFEE